MAVVDGRWPAGVRASRCEARGPARRSQPAVRSLPLSPVAGSDAWQAPVPLTETTDSETYPRVSPDGTKVAFISERDSEDDVDMWWMPVPSAAIAKPIPLGARPPKPVSSSVPAVGDERPSVARHSHDARARTRGLPVVGAGQYPRRVLRGARRHRLGVGRHRGTAAPGGRGRATAAREAGRATATGVAEGRRAGVVAGRQVAARLRPAGSATGLQRQSAPQRSGSAAALRAECRLPVVAHGRAAAGARRRRCRACRGGRVTGALRRDVRSRVDDLEVALLLRGRHRRAVGERAREIPFARHRREERSRSGDRDRRDGGGAADHQAGRSRRTAPWWCPAIRWRRKPADWLSKKAATWSTR